VERVLAEAKRTNVRVFTPKPGQSVEPTTSLPIEPWWPEIPWENAIKDPIVSSQVPREEALRP
jgi:hypothetical protein